VSGRDISSLSAADVALLVRGQPATALELAILTSNTGRLHDTLPTGCKGGGSWGAGAGSKSKMADRLVVSSPVKPATFAAPASFSSSAKADGTLLRAERSADEVVDSVTVEDKTRQMPSKVFVFTAGPVGFLQNELQKLQQLQIHGFMSPESHDARARYLQEHGYVPEAGVGMTISEIHPFTIVTLRPDGPAKKTEVIRIGDELKKVDGYTLEGILTGEQVAPPSRFLSLALALALALSRARALSLSLSLALYRASACPSTASPRHTPPGIPPVPV
jgi:hypothetical protein